MTTLSILVILYSNVKISKKITLSQGTTTIAKSLYPADHAKLKRGKERVLPQPLQKVAAAASRTKTFKALLKPLHMDFDILSPTMKQKWFLN